MRLTIFALVLLLLELAHHHKNSDKIEPKKRHVPEPPSRAEVIDYRFQSVAFVGTGTDWEAYRDKPYEFLSLAADQT
jgi:hypothetical protein